ncbi:MAG: hypothetical protein K2F70_07710, partial [Muribaculaceae bacterium]|nr:hypothetical protein [Muribaculaceae bacterium]
NKGIAYIVDWSDGGAGYWMFDPMKPQSGVTNFLAGTKDNNGAYFYEGNPIGGGATGISFYGEGEDTKMYVWCEDYPKGDGNNLIRYSVGEATVLDFGPDMIYEGSHGKFANLNVNVQATKNGVLASQVRTAGNNSAGCPVFIFYNNAGEPVLNGGDIKEITSSCAGAAFNNDLSLFAIGGNNTNISLWSVEWDGETPSISYLYDIPGSNYSTEAVQIAWDNANNLYAYIRAEGLRVFALRQDEPKAVTNAPASYILDITSGVENITVDVEEANGPVEFWNLQGVKVNSENLTPGIYIRRQGQKAEKVVIR